MVIDPINPADRKIREDAGNVEYPTLLYLGRALGGFEVSCIICYMTFYVNGISSSSYVYIYT